MSTRHVGMDEVTQSVGAASRQSDIPTLKPMYMKVVVFLQNYFARAGNC